MQFAKWWREQPHRLTYDLLKSDPQAFFGALWRGWELEFAEADVDRAAAYARTQYHGDSGKASARGDEPVLSERRFVLPPEAVRLYLNHRFVRGFMESMGWSVNAEDYGV